MEEIVKEIHYIAIWIMALIVGTIFGYTLRDWREIAADIKRLLSSTIVCVARDDDASPAAPAPDAPGAPADETSDNRHNADDANDMADND